MPAQNTIKCSKCGTAKGTTNVRLKKLIAKYGSKEKLEAVYVCRDCKSGTPKGGKTKKSKLPTSKVICSKCNGKYGTTKTRMDKMISQYGSLEEVHANYVCRKCRKELNVDRRGQIKPKRRKRKKIKYKRDDNGKVILPDWMKSQAPAKPIPMTPEQYKAVDTCWRPDIYLKNKALNKGKGACNGCPFYETACGCNLRKLAKVKKTKTKAKKAKKKAKKKTKKKK